MAALAVFVAGAVAAASCSARPATRCGAGRGAWSAKYLPPSGPDAGACVVSGEVLFLQTYNPPPTELSPASIAIEGTSVAGAVAASGPDPDSAHTPFALGAFGAVYPSSDGFCDVASLGAAL